MKIYIVLLLLNCLTLLGQNNNRLELSILNDSINLYKDEFEKNILKEIIPKDIVLNYQLINKSKYTYAVFIDPEKFLVYETTDVKKYFKPTESQLKKQILQLAVIIKDSANQITQTGFSLYGNYFEKLPIIKTVMKDKMVLIKPFSKIKLHTKISLPILNNNISKGVFSSQYFLSISLDGMKEGQLSIRLNQDKCRILKQLNPSIINKLNREQILIYDGVIISNEIPVIVK